MFFLLYFDPIIASLCDTKMQQKDFNRIEWGIVKCEAATLIDSPTISPYISCVCMRAFCIQLYGTEYG